MHPNDDIAAQGATPVSSESIGGSAAPTQAKPRWDPKGRRNMIVIGGVVGVAVLMLMLLFLGGKDNEDKKASVIVEARSDQPAVNGMLSEADRAAISAQENTRIAAALSGQQSAVGTAVQPGTIQPIIAQPQTNAPLTEQGEVRLNQQQTAQPNGVQAPAQSTPPGPDESKMKGLETQMTSMMAAWGMHGSDGGQRTLSTYVREPRKTGNGASGSQVTQEVSSRASSQRSANDLMIVKAYDAPAAAEMISGADSDTPGKVRARILSGPLTGAVVVGAIHRIGDQGFQTDFSTASFNGRTIKITAYGMDGEASGDIVRGEYDGRFMQRYVFPVVAEGVKAYAGARAQVGTQVIAITLPGAGAGAVTGAQQTPAPSAEQARNAMFSSGANQVSRALATGPQDGHVLLAPGKQIGVVFEESIYQSDLAGQSRQGDK